MIRKNDTVMVITGKDRGKTGKVLSVLRGEGRALVEKLNLVKRHQRPTQKMPKGGVLEKEASIHLSNLMIYCHKCKKPVRVSMKVDAENKSERVCKKCKGVVSHA